MRSRETLQVGLIAVNLRIERVGKWEEIKGGDKFGNVDRESKKAPDLQSGSSTLKCGARYLDH